MRLYFAPENDKLHEVIYMQKKIVIFTPISLGFSTVLATGQKRRKLEIQGRPRGARQEI